MAPATRVIATAKSAPGHLFFVVIFITCLVRRRFITGPKVTGLAALAVGLSRFVRLRRCEPAEGAILLVRDAIRKRRLSLGHVATEEGGVVWLSQKSALH